MKPRGPRLPQQLCRGPRERKKKKKREKERERESEKEIKRKGEKERNREREKGGPKSQCRIDIDCTVKAL